MAFPLCSLSFPYSRHVRKHRTCYIAAAFDEQRAPKMSREAQDAEDPSMARHGLEKRKACDLCHIKKIRCDATRPVCSHCVVYGAQCTYTPHIKRRRKEVKVRKNVAITLSLSNQEIGLESKHQSRDLRFQTDIPLATDTATPERPPMVDLLPILQDYFTNLNSIIPLFEQGSFKAILDDAQASASQASISSAAINVILALTLQYRATDQPHIPGFDLATCTSNARRIINGLGSGHDDLLTLQVLLGLVILHLGTPHPGVAAANSLIGSAVKLAYKLRLHRSKANDLFDALTRLQRVRVFWIAFILDRDISLRTHEPPLLQERDHDVDIPSSTQDSGMIRFTSETKGERNFDLFQAWIQLSYIQGEIYEELYSIRAESFPVETRQSRTRDVHALLGKWLEKIPSELHPTRLANVFPKHATGHMISLYFTRLSCFLHTHKVGTTDAEWITRLVNYSQQIVGSTGSEGLINTASSSFLEPTPAWPEVVEAARECAALFHLVEQDDSRLRWSVSCTYMSATIVLIANMLTVSEHGHEAEAGADERLIDEALAFLEWSTTKMPEWNTFHKLYAACAELSCRARIARAKFALGRAGPKTASVAWLEEQASRSAGHSALALVAAFTSAEEKPLTSRLWQAGV